MSFGRITVGTCFMDQNHIVLGHSFKNTLRDANLPDASPGV